MPETPADHDAAFLLAAAFRGMVEDLHRRLADAGYPGVTATHGFALQALGEGCTSAQLGRRLGVSKQAAGRTARSLERLHFLERSADTEDAREQLLVPSARGRALLAASGRILAELVAGWRAQVGDAAVDTTLTTLAAVDHGTRAPTDISTWR